MVLPDQRLETFRKANETDSQRAVLEDFTHFVIRSEFVGIDPDALPHEEGIIAYLLDALCLQTLQKLLEHQGNLVVQTLKKGVHVTMGTDAQPGQIQGSEAQIAAPVDDFPFRIVRVADHPCTASHIGNFCFRASCPVIRLVKRRIKEGKIREQTPGRHPAGKAEQVIVRIALAVIDAFLHLEDMNGENRRFAVTQSRFRSQQHVADDHAPLRAGVRAVVDGAERNLRSGAAVHGVQIMHQRFHGLITVFFGQFQSLVHDLFRLVGRHFGHTAGQSLTDEEHALVSENGLSVRQPGAQRGLDRRGVITADIQNQSQLAHKTFGHAFGHAVFKIGDALPAVLVVLVGLEGDAGQRAVALNALRLAQETMAGIEPALEKFLDVDLAAGSSEGEKIQIVDMNISVLMRLAVLGLQHVHFVKLLGCLTAVFEHGAHGGIAVNIGVFPLQVTFAGILEREVTHGQHQAGLALTHAGTLIAVQNISLCGAGVAELDQSFFHQILHFFHIGQTGPLVGVTGFQF